MAESIAALNIRLVADVKQYDAEMQSAARRAQMTASGISGSMGKVSARIGFGMLGVGGAAALAAREIRNVVRNIDQIPGVPRDVVQSIQLMKEELGSVQNVVQRGVASIVSWAAAHARNVGLVVGGLIYGKEAAQDAAAAIEEAARTAYRRTPEYIEAELKATEQLKEAREQLFNVGESRAGAISRMMRESAEMEKQARDIDDPLKRMQAETAAIKLQAQAEKDLNGLREQFLAARAGASSNDPMQGDPSARVRRLKQEIDSLKGSIEALNLEGQVTPQQLEKGLKYYEALAKKNQEFAAAQADVMTSMRYFRDAVARMYENVGDRAAEAFGDMVLTGKASFGELANIVARSMIEIVARMAVINPLMNAIFGLSGSSILPAFFGKGAIKAAASGGNFGAGDVGLVGENGPELVRFNRDSQVISNTRSRQLSGGSGGTYYIDARGADREGMRRIEAQIAELNGSIERRSLGAVMDAQRRGIF